MKTQCSTYGEVTDVRVSRDKWSYNDNSHYAVVFVEFKDVQSAEKAMKGLKEKDKDMVVNWAKPRPPPKGQGKGLAAGVDLLDIP